MNDVVNKQLVKSLEERCAKVFLEEVDKSHAEDLVALLVVPSLGGFEVEAVGDGLEDEAEEATHEGEVVLVEGGKLGHILIILRGVDVPTVFLVYQSRCLLLYRQIDDSRQLLTPNLLPRHVQKV